MTISFNANKTFTMSDFAKVVCKEDLTFDITHDAKLFVNEVRASEGVTEYIMTLPLFRSALEDGARQFTKKQTKGLRKLLRKYA